MPRVADNRFRAVTGFLKAHREQPDVSLAAHVGRRKAELARLVLSRTRVYLDTRFWIYLRDAARGKPVRTVHACLLEILRTGVAQGDLICPLSDSAFFELLRQKKWERRQATIRLIDELSLGVTIQNAKDRVGTEVLGFLTGTVLKKKVPGPPIDRVWLKVGHVLGTPVPVMVGLEDAEQLAIQKAFADFLWTMSLEEILTETPLPEHHSDSDRKLAERITARSRRAANEMKSFESVYVAEIAGFWDAYEECVGPPLEFFMREMFPQMQPVPRRDRDEMVKQLKNAFRNIVKYRKVGSALPTAQIIAGLHAIIRWNKIRGFKPTDFCDFYHAAAALPYCDVFLTERFLATMLTRPPLSFARRFDTAVHFDEAAAVDALDTYLKGDRLATNL